MSARTVGPPRLFAVGLEPNQPAATKNQDNATSTGKGARGDSVTHGPFPHFDEHVALE